MSPIPKLISILALTPLICASILEKPVEGSNLEIFTSAKAFPKISSDDNDDTPLPLVIWHGLGDNYQAEGLASVAQLAINTNPGTFTYIIHLDEDAGNDRTATFFGNLTLQIEKVCNDLAAHPILSTAPAIDALGFSQGGQFLRGYIERCNFPPVRSLVTFGSQHNGISQFQTCGATDFLCKASESLLRLNTFSSFVQSRLVPAQYFRDPEEGKYKQYLEGSNFLADINNERELKNQTYKKNLASLERFTMYVFEEDQTVVPKESGWWSEVNGTEVIPLRERQLYKEDWLGLKKLDEEGKLIFKSTKGKHMSLSEGLLEKVFKDNFGVFGRKFDSSEGSASSETILAKSPESEVSPPVKLYIERLESLERENQERLRKESDKQDEANRARNDYWLYAGKESREIARINTPAAEKLREERLLEIVAVNKEEARLHQEKIDEGLKFVVTVQEDLVQREDL